MSCEWATPKAVYDQLEAEFGPFDLDPCPKGYEGLWSGLTAEWTGRVFMNPPYGREIGKWLKKAYESSLKGALAVCLIPSRTDTRWWHQYVMKGHVRFIEGRLCFNDDGKPAPFPSAVVVFKPVKS
ncbi:MAG: adenine methyltransferase [Chloroflexi bacterium]|nr:adenine methyltransferase [Chloroflexota bacterium]